MKRSQTPQVVDEVQSAEELQHFFAFIHTYFSPFAFIDYWCFETPQETNPAGFNDNDKSSLILYGMPATILNKCFCLFNRFEIYQ